MAEPLQELEALVAQEDLPNEQIRRFGPDAVPALIDIFRTASGKLYDRKRRRALHALGVLGGGEAVDFLISTAEDPDVEGWLQRAAVRSLGPSGGARARDYLVSALDHASFGVRSSAVTALSRFSDAEAVRGLERASEGDPDVRIRRRSARALEGEQHNESGRGEPAHGAKVRN